MLKCCNESPTSLRYGIMELSDAVPIGASMIQNIDRASVSNSSICEQRVESGPFLPHFGVHLGLIIVVGDATFDEMSVRPQLRYQSFPRLFLDIYACDSPTVADQATCQIFTHAGLQSRATSAAGDERNGKIGIRREQTSRGRRGNNFKNVTDTYRSTCDNSHTL
jgi:hypothetical protein